MNDKEVYVKLLEEKCKGYHKAFSVLVVICILLLCACIVFACLYFCSGSIGKTTEIDIRTDGGQITNSNINTVQSAVHGDVKVETTNTNQQSIVVVVAIAISVVVIGGCLCLFLYLKR